MTDSDFHRLAEKIRRRPTETVSGQWFNVIAFGGCNFIQGSIYDDDAREGVMRNIACLVDSLSIDDIAGFWPVIEGHPVTASEESALVDYIASRDAHEVEMIVPERNRARPVDWDRFDDTSEYALYKEYIYPAIIETMGGIDFCSEMEDRLRTDDSDGGVLRLLDMGCGAGNLIEDINERFFFEEGERQQKSGTNGNLNDTVKNRVPRFKCYGIDNNPANIDAAEEENIPDIYLGDCENIDGILPQDMHFDLIIFSGLLNRQVVDRDKALRIFENAILKLTTGGHIIITGYTSCHLTAEDLTARGIDVLRKSIPHNLFKDYMNYYLRQIYLGRKIY
ncbi:MAG: class I SAM-dependent methyltransferase [Deltaproteobacteria bacterium]|nr:class I SAM-dependent methyltransferase [Deltaproteobacteria bacterium]